MNNWHPWQLKKSKSWGPFWSYHLGSTANPAHLPKKMAVLFSWYLQNSPQDFIFFNLGVQKRCEAWNLDLPTSDESEPSWLEP
jgi:hypothetical protein